MQRYTVLKMDVSHIKFTYFCQDYFTDTDNKIREENKMAMLYISVLEAT